MIPSWARRAAVIVAIVGACGCFHHGGNAPQSDTPTGRADLEKNWQASQRAQGYQSLPGDCPAAEAPIESQEEAVCVALAYLGDVIDRAASPYVYRAVQVGG